MVDIVAKLRYFPLGPVCGPAVPVRVRDLDDIATRYNVGITLDEVEGKNAHKDGDAIREETIESTVEEISQLIITVTSQDKNSFKKAISELVAKYRAPRTVYGTWGSNEEGKRLLSRVFEENDGWL